MIFKGKVSDLVSTLNETTPLKNEPIVHMKKGWRFEPNSIIARQKFEEMTSTLADFIDDKSKKTVIVKIPMIIIGKTKKEHLPVPAENITELHKLRDFKGKPVLVAITASGKKLILPGEGEFTW